LHRKGLYGPKIRFLKRPENFSRRGKKKGAIQQESMGKSQYPKTPRACFASIYLNRKIETKNLELFLKIPIFPPGGGRIPNPQPLITVFFVPLPARMGT
jgi:hypothetical protein